MADRYKPTRLWSRAMAGEKRTPPADTLCKDCGESVSLRDMFAKWQPGECVSKWGPWKNLVCGRCHEGS